MENNSRSRHYRRKQKLKAFKEISVFYGAKGVLQSTGSTNTPKTVH